MTDESPIRWLSRGMDDVPGNRNWLSAAEASRAEGMRHAKRRLEYELGRWCAKSAVAATLGSNPGADVEIGHLPEGAPAAFVSGEPFAHRISMTDRADWAVCAVAPPGVEVGCDLELVEHRSPAFVSDYFTKAEQRLARTGDEVDQVIANLIWSAKESALKVLRTGLRRDTRSVEVNPVIESGNGWLPLTVESEEGEVFPGWWRRFDAFVLSFAADAPTGPPEALENPISLATAQPSHRWMKELT